MHHRSTFHLDCNPIIPECGYRCGQCLQEIRSIIEPMRGGAKLYTEGSGEHTRIVVEHDACLVTGDQLMQALRGLPSFYKGFFVPSLLEAYPIINVPAELLGSTKRHRHQDILAGCQGKTYVLGWILFGKDGSLYFHRRGKLPVTEIGIAASKGGKLITTESADISSLALESRVGTHLSLHPSGQVHVKSGTGHRICVGSIGPWLPVQQAFTFAHVFTEPIGSLPETCGNKQPSRMVQGSDLGCSLRLDLIIAPLNEKDGKVRVPFPVSTIFVGLSPRYAVLVNAAPHAACEPRIYFLSRS